MRPQEKAVLVRQASSSWDMGASKNFRLQLSRLVSPTAWTGVGRSKKPVNSVEHNSLSCVRRNYETSRNQTEGVI